MLSSTYIEHYKSLLKLGIPIIIGQLGMIVQGIADSAMIGHYGPSSLAASGFVNNIMNLAIIFGMGFSYGLTPVVGRLFGEGEQAKVSRALKSSIGANLLLSAIVVAILTATLLNISHLGQPEELIPLMGPYFLTLIISVPFMQLFYGYKQFSDGIGDTRMPMWVMLGGNIFNILGNYLLIFGKCGLPEWGLFGAGVATMLSRVLMWLVMHIAFHFGSRYRTFRAEYARVSFSLGDFKLLNRLGWPTALQMGMETGSFSLSALYMGWIGATALASHQILCIVGTTCYMVYYGIGAAVTIRESHFHGRGDLKSIRRTAFSGFHLILLFGLIAATLIFLSRHHLGALFTDDLDISLMTASLVIPFVAYQFGDGLQCCFANALRGIEDVKIMVWYAFIAYIVISLPLSYIFAFPCGLGAIGVWMGFPFGLTSAGLMFLLRFLHKTRSSV